MLWLFTEGSRPVMTPLGKERARHPCDASHPPWQLPSREAFILHSSFHPKNVIGVIHIFSLHTLLARCVSSCQSRLSHPYRCPGNMSDTKRSDDLEAQTPGTPTRSSFRPLVGTPTRSSFRTLLRTPLGTPLGSPLKLKFSQSPAPTVRVDTEYNVSTGRKFAYLSVYFMCNIALTIYNKAVLGKVKTVFSYSGPPKKCIIQSVVLTRTQFAYPWLLTAIHTGSASIGCSLLLLQGSFHLSNLSSQENLILVAFSVLFTINIAISNVSL